MPASRNNGPGRVLSRRTIGSVVLSRPNNRSRMHNALSDVCNRHRDAGVNSEAPLIIPVEELWRTMQEQAELAGVPLPKSSETSLTSLLIEAENRKFITLEIIKQNNLSSIQSITILSHVRVYGNSIVPKVNGYGELSEKEKYMVGIGLAAREYDCQGQMPTKQQLLNYALLRGLPNEWPVASEVTVGHRNVHTGSSLDHVDAPMEAMDDPDTTMVNEEERHINVTAESPAEHRDSGSQGTQTANMVTSVPSTPSRSIFAPMTGLVPYVMRLFTPESMPRRGPSGSIPFVGSLPPSPSPNDYAISPDGYRNSQQSVNNNNGTSSSAQGDSDVLGPLDALDSAVGNVRRVVLLSYNENTRLRQQVNHYVAQINDLESQGLAIQAQLETAMSENTNLQEQNQQLHQENQDLHSESIAHQTESDNLRHERCELLTRVSATNAELAQLRLEFQLSEGNSHARISTLTSDRDTLAQEKRDLDRRFTKLKEAVQQLNMLASTS